MLKSTILSLTCCLFIGPHTYAQCTNVGSNLVAPYASNTSNEGVMFDISATKTVTISCFDANLTALSIGKYEIYYKAGTYLGSEMIPENWELIGSSGSIASVGFNEATSFEIPVNILIPAGQTYAFYITANDTALSTSLLTTINSGYTTISSNEDLSISGGTGINYPFNTVTQNRSFNGTVSYTTQHILTVEFIDFSVSKVNKAALLEWQTEAEHNSGYFEVERSNNGANWNNIFTTQAAGESVSPTQYYEIDPDPLEGISYYRLNQYDLDGAKTVLKVVSFNNEMDIAEKEIRVYPNPVAEQVRVFGDKSELKSLNIFNSVGQDISGNLTIISHNGYSDVYFENQQEGVFILKSKTNSQILIKK